VSDDPFYSRKHKLASVRFGKPGQQLLEFRKDVDRDSCDLRDDGEYAIEAGRRLRSTATFTSRGAADDCRRCCGNTSITSGAPGGGSVVVVGAMIACE
jgi:hypothetical protein